MKRSAAVVLGTTLLAAACGQGDDDGAIVASGHVEATEVLISTKVAGTLEVLAVDEGTVVEDEALRLICGARPTRHEAWPGPGV